MKYIKEYENYTQKNIDKKYYVWKAAYFPVEKVAIIEILDSTTKNIKYVAVKRTDWRGKDFFTDKKQESITYGNFVQLRKWKRDKYNILFETDSEEDAIDFYTLYIGNREVITKDNWQMYRNANKYNI